MRTVMAELVDAPDLGSGKYSCGGSSPPNRNYIKIIFMNLESIDNFVKSYFIL